MITKVKTCPLQAGRKCLPDCPLAVSSYSEPHRCVLWCYATELSSISEGLADIGPALRRMVEATKSVEKS